MTRLLWIGGVVLLGAFLVSGCGSAQVSDERGNNSASAPPMIYVADFDLGAAAIKSDPGTVTGRSRLGRIFAKDPATELEDLQNLLATTLVDDLHQEKLPARRLNPGDPPPAAGWVVRGQFVEVNEGNRMQKAVVGFGAGNSETTLMVSVTDLARKAGDDLLDFNLDAKGEQGPSGVGVSAATHNPYAMAAKFVMSRDASEKDVRRAAGEIAKRLKKRTQVAPSH